MINKTEKVANSYKILAFWAVIMATLFNQSNIIFGINISFSDLFALIILFVLILKKELVFPVIPTLFFLFLSTVVLFMAGFYVPSKYSFDPTTILILDYVKMVAAFVYFIIGTNLARLNMVPVIIKWFSLCALFIGFIALIFTIFNISFMADILYFGETRFRGLMNDPNYFSILQLAALAYFLSTKSFTKLFKILAIVILVVSILISGSKTGLLTLILFTSVKLSENLISQCKNYTDLIKRISIIFALVVTIPILVIYSESLLNPVSLYIPSFDRVSVLFTDFNSAISTGGSERDATWEIAVELIKLSPILGIGIGTYTGLATQFWGYGAVAHNTYLQLAVEWGLLFTIVFFVYIFLLLLKVTFNNSFKSEMNIILRDIIFVFLIGSFAISLNNARFFWLVLGALTYSIAVNWLKTKRGANF